MIRVFDMFAGYGGAEFALKKAGIEHECIGFSEIDKYAIQCFKQNHGDIKNYGDCTKINPNELPDFDLLCGGFPCQSFSIAGKGLGELDTRGTLFNEIIRIAEVKKPTYMLLENVKGLTFKTHKATFDKILSELNRIGYGVHVKVLNSKDYGIPQNRERVWFVCKLGGWKLDEFKFPEPRQGLTLKDILLEEVDEKYYLTESQINTMKRNFGAKGKILEFECDSLIEKQTFPSRINQIKGDIIVPTLATAMGTGGGNVPVITNASKRECGFHEESPALCARDYKEPKIILNPFNHKISNEEIGTIGTSVGTTTGKTSQIVLDKRFRRLTPIECFRLMGFVNDEINLDGLSDTQKYKLAGNGWEINVVSLIFKEMLL